MINLRVSCFLHRYGLHFFLVASIYCWWKGARAKDSLPSAREIDHRLFAQPIQSETDAEKFLVKVGDRPFHVTPRYRYEITGLVVSRHHSDSLMDFYHRQTGDYFNVCDLALTWGLNTKTGIYEKGKFRSSDFTAWVDYEDSLDWYSFRMNEFSNNHLITEDPDLRATLKSVGVGDQIRISGLLAEYFSPPDYQRGTSTSRDDTGGGACETIYVKNVEILKKANTGWRMMESVGMVMTLTLVVLLVLSRVAKWTKRRRELRLVDELYSELAKDRIRSVSEIENQSAESSGKLCLK